MSEESGVHDFIKAVVDVTRLDLPPSSSNPKGFHIGVGCSPVMDYNLQPDVDMVRAALLYADHVTLYSPMAILGLSIRQVQDYDITQKLALIYATAHLLKKTDDEVTALRRIIREDRRALLSIQSPKRKRVVQPEIETRYAALWSRLSGVAKRQAEALGANELMKAAQSGSLTIHRFRNLDNPNALVKEFVGALEGTLLSSSVFPLFDDGSGSLMRAGVDDGVISVGGASIARGKHCALAANLIERLPLFELATVDEILDIRRRFESPLVRFRSAVIGFSETIQSAAWNSDFEQEADTLFLKSVAPVVEEIRDATRGDKYLAELIPAVLEKGMGQNSLIGIVLSQTDLLKDAVLKNVVLVGASTLLAARTVQVWRDRRASAESNHLWFYFRAGEHLKRTRAANKARGGMSLPKGRLYNK